MSSAQRKLTPMMQQYEEVKAKRPPNSLLLFRLGDFYEMFDEDARIDGTNIPPARLNLGWSRIWTDSVSTRIQSSTYFDRDAPAGPANNFDGYTLLDLLVSWKVGGGKLDLGISNLLDKQYITYYAQTSPAAGRYFAGRGRTLNLRFSRDF